MTPTYNLQINDKQDNIKQQITTFSDFNSGFDVETPTAPLSSFGMADTSDDALGDFFSRPIKIGAYAWAPTTTFFEVFNPWTQFLENPRVINRLSNYNLLRGTLCVKILVNGNGFHYGRLLVSYLPFANRDSFFRNRALISEDSIEASQRMHLYIDPTTSTGGSMKLPFLWPLNALSIPSEDWDDMGLLSIRQLNPLKNANGALDPVTISVFAWMEDIELSVPTTAEPGALAPQSQGYVPQADEYEEKPASSAMLAAGDAAAAVGAAIPQVAPLAEPTSLVLSGAGNVAKAMGYSRPRNLDPVQPYRPTFLGNMANANAPDSSVSLTLDQKAGLTPDTRSFGLDGSDELEVTSISGRETYLTTFAWPVSAPAEDLLWNSRVTPQLIAQRTVGGVDEIHLTPMAYLSYMARYWRGTIRFRFQIVASSFHKGRMKIVWDPEYMNSNEYNVAYTHIVDISETRDFTIDVGWGSPRPYLLCSSAAENYGVTPLTGSFTNFNGVLSVYVVNDLAVPNSTIDNDISVNVMVCSPDLELQWPQSPSDRLGYHAAFAPQSVGYEPHAMGDAVDSMQNEPVAEDAQQVGTYRPSSHLEFFGDPIPSLRLLMKKYAYYATHHLGNGNPKPAVAQLEIPSRPQEQGFAPFATYPTVPGPAFANFVELVPMAYIMRMFACWRGGIRYKVLITHDNSSDVALPTRGVAVVENADEDNMSVDRAVASVDYTNDASLARAHLLRYRSLSQIGHATVLDHNPVLEFEIPYYRPERFSLARNYSDGEIPRVTVRSTIPVGGSFHHLFTSCGEDFQVGMFVGTPILYPQPVPAAV